MWHSRKTGDCSPKTQVLWFAGPDSMVCGKALNGSTHGSAGTRTRMVRAQRKGGTRR